MPLVTIAENAIYYEDYGAGPALIFAHGVGGNHASWHKQVDAFADRYRVIVFDHRGFGNSDDRGKVGQSRYVPDLAGMMDALGIARAFLVGQSMGGGTCANFTCTYPERVIGLVIANSLIGLEVNEPLQSEIKSRLDQATDLSQAERVLGPRIRRDDPASVRLYLQIASFNDVTIQTLRGQMPRWKPAMLAATGVPVRFIAGQDDVLFPPASISAVHTLVPGSTYTAIPGSGHSAYFEDAQAFNAALADFLTSCDDADVR